MVIKKDIETREDIDSFLRSFYQRVIADKQIGIIFTEIVPINWEQHIPVITDFWETILLDNPVYRKNAMEVHYKINRIFPLKKEHFEAWLYIFNLTLNEMFEGKIADLAKKRAASIALLMESKMNER
ncbi:MAG: group III truncated hemoglobin [Ferruginibacter sp.]